MAANTSPIFYHKTLLGAVTIATANAEIVYVSGALGTVYTAVTDGSEVSVVKIQAASTTTAGMVRLWHYDGSTNRLLHEVVVSAVTPSATAANFSAVVGFDPPLALENGDLLKASTEKANTFNVFAFAGEFT